MSKTVSTPDNKTFNVFVSGQHTKAAYDELQRCLQSYTDVIIKASCPRFNVIEQTNEWKSMQMDRIDVKNFGINIPNAVKGLCDHPEVLAELKKLGVEPLKYNLDNFIRTGKTGKMNVVVAFLRDEAKKLRETIEILGNTLQCKAVTDSSTLLTDKAEQFTTAADQLENFIRKIKPEELQEASITSLNKWEQFLQECKIPENWKSSLEFSRIMTLFGLSESDCKLLNAVPYQDKEQSSTLQDSCVTWISKMVNGYRIDGCLTDVVNMVYAVMGISPIGQSEYDVVDVLDEFQAKFQAKNIDGLWIPDLHLHDGEKDDLLVHAIIRVLAKRAGKSVQTKVQLPLPEKEDPTLTKIVDKVASWKNTTVFRDPMSKNTKPVKKTFEGII